jgi:hypothetical protein
MPQIIWAGQSGCLLPLLIILNLLFGKVIFNSTLLWLAVEAALIFIFIVKVLVLMHRIKKQFFAGSGNSDSDSQIRRQGSAVVDVEGKVVEDGGERS